MQRLAGKEAKCGPVACMYASEFGVLSVRLGRQAADRLCRAKLDVIRRPGGVMLRWSCIADAGTGSGTAGAGASVGASDSDGDDARARAGGCSLLLLELMWETVCLTLRVYCRR